MNVDIQRSVDVLATLAQLPNDEVFTTPKLAAVMLDALPKEAWSNPDWKWLDPATKSGVFLREIYRRLMVGLATWETDPMKRRTHILTNMIFGSAITEVTGEVARRTLYQSRDATGAGVVDQEVLSYFVKFPRADGNVPYIPTEHRFSGSKHQHHCEYCGAPEALVRDNRQTYAYAFIHKTYPTQELRDMKFDVIVGNPPYQIGVKDNTRDRPIYHLFVEQAIALDPRYVLMITPSRWFSGGLGLDEYRARMIADRRLKAIVDNPRLFDVFPGVEIKGGVSWFLWDREYEGDCDFSTRVKQQVTSTAARDLRHGDGIVLRDNAAARIVDKVRAQPFVDGSLADVVSAGVAFGDSFRTNFKGAEDEPFRNSIPLIFGNRVGYVRLEQIERNVAWINKWKVLIPNAGDGHGREENYVLGEPIALAPGSACTQTYLVAGTFITKKEAENYAKYLTTKFVRFLVLQRKTTQHVKPDKFKFVPWLDFNREWTDADLNDRYRLTGEEISYIDATIKERTWVDSLDSPVPYTHMPGGKKHGAKVAIIEDDE